MQKILFGFLGFVAIIFYGCKNPAVDVDNPLEKVTWEQLVKEHPFMEGFPKFDGDIEGYVYKETMGLESVVFFDYKCDESVATMYYDKLLKAGFTTEGYDMYKKRTDIYNYDFIGGYAAGNFALSFNCEKR